MEEISYVPCLTNSAIHRLYMNKLLKKKNRDYILTTTSDISVLNTWELAVLLIL